MDLIDLATIQLTKRQGSADWIVKVKDIKQVHRVDASARLTLGTGEEVLVEESVNQVQTAINALWDQYAQGRDTEKVEITDGITAPGASSGKARIYVDTSDGDLKVVFADGTVKTITTDT